MTLTGVPAVALAGALTLKWVAASSTAMLRETPVTEELAVSVAVIVWAPAVSRVALKVPVPLVNVVSAGRLASWSLLVKCTVPV